MVTFLVCLVVVGGASILILRVTLEDVFQGATGDLASDGGSPPRSLASRVAGFVSPRRSGTPHAEATGPASDPATLDLTRPVPVAGAAAPQDAPPVTTPAVSREGVLGGDAGDHPEGWRGEGATSSVLLEERTAQVRVADEPEPKPQVATPSPARDRPRLVASRPPLPPLPPLRRRLLARAFGAVKLLVLLVVVGSVLALLLGAAALLFAYAMRAAIGA